MQACGAASTLNAEAETVEGMLQPRNPGHHDAAALENCPKLMREGNAVKRSVRSFFWAIIFLDDHFRTVLCVLFRNSLASPWFV